MKDFEIQNGRAWLLSANFSVSEERGIKGQLTVSEIENSLCEVVSETRVFICRPRNHFYPLSNNYGTRYEIISSKPRKCEVAK